MQRFIVIFRIKMYMDGRTFTFNLPAISEIYEDKCVSYTEKLIHTCNLWFGPIPALFINTIVGF